MYLLNKKNILLCGMLLASALQGVSATSDDESWVCWLVDSTLNYGPAVAGGTAGATAFYAINRAYYEYLLHTELGKISPDLKMSQEKKEQFARRKVDQYLNEMSNLGWYARHGLIFLGSVAVGILVCKRGNSFVESTINKRNWIKQNNALVQLKAEYPNMSVKQKELFEKRYADVFKKDVSFANISMQGAVNDYNNFSSDEKAAAMWKMMSLGASGPEADVAGLCEKFQADINNYKARIKVLGNFGKETQNIKGISWLNTLGLPIQGDDADFAKTLENAASTDDIKVGINALKNSCGALLGADQDALYMMMPKPSGGTIKASYNVQMASEKPSLFQHTAATISPLLVLEGIRQIPTALRYLLGRNIASDENDESNVSYWLFTIHLQVLPQISTDMAKIESLDYDDESEDIKKKIEYKLNAMHSSLIDVEVKLMKIPDDSEDYEAAMDCKKAVWKLRDKVVEYADEHSISLIGLQAQVSGN